MTATDTRPAPTAQEARALRCISESVASRGFPPTIRELGDALDVRSSSTVVHYLRKLEWKGWIVRTANTDRGLRLVGGGSGPCPVCGHGGES